MGLDTGHQLRAILNSQQTGIQLVLAVLGDTLGEE
jgi:hypothetical protein